LRLFVPIDELSIRAYDPFDEARVIALWADAFPDSPPWNDPSADIVRKLSVQPDLFLIAELGQSIVGTAMGGFDGHRGWVYYLAVALEHRRKGIARELMSSLEARLLDYGCTKVNLQVRATNQDVVDFYLELGYAVEDRISMGKRLDS